MFETNTYFTDENGKDLPKFSLEGSMRTHNELQRISVPQFEGIPVRIDKGLEGNQFYCAVSSELYKQLQDL